MKARWSQFMELPTIVSFWHGPLTWLEALCISSFVRQGHKVDIYGYDKIDALPDGAQWRDASDILPIEELVFYKGIGTPAVFSDRFRLELLRLGLGVYSDLDIYCIAPISKIGDYLMAWETPKSINNAVLYIPPDAILLDDLIGVFTDKSFLLPYLPPIRRLEVAIRRLNGDPLPPENMQFGATGPMPLTYFVKKNGLLGQVRTATTFYPVPYNDIPLLMSTNLDIASYIQPETLGIHLWRSQLTDRGRVQLKRPPHGSAMATLCAAENISFEDWLS
jgi:hypothetical protein